MIFSCSEHSASLFPSFPCDFFLSERVARRKTGKGENERERERETRRKVLMNSVIWRFWKWKDTHFLRKVFWHRRTGVTTALRTEQTMFAGNLIKYQWKVPDVWLDIEGEGEDPISLCFSLFSSVDRNHSEFPLIIEFHQIDNDEHSRFSLMPDFAERTQLESSPTRSETSVYACKDDFYAD